MDILTSLMDEGQWHRYLRYKIDSGHLAPGEEKELTEFIQQQRYRPIVQQIIQGCPFPRPRRTAISKMHSMKKRIVYIYPKDEGTVLKLLTFLLLRNYDHLFSPYLYSFRSGFSAKDAIRYLSNCPDIGRMWSYKVDISDYFNSIPVDQLLPIMSEALADDPKLYRFLETLLNDPYVYDGPRLIRERKGIMAGTPFSTFLANLYLAEMDRIFTGGDRIYARYSDDIILFAPTQDALEQDISLIHRYLADAGLSINPAKECRTSPGQQWTFLGFSWQDGIIDIAPASIEKLKGKMRRKARALMRWRDRKGVEHIHAARAFIKVFNRKLLEHSQDHDLTWARWYFPTITTADSLHVIDRYAQSCIRYLATGKRNKRAYDLRYEDMKRLGYISLVNRYYSGAQEKIDEVV
ncbi:MAG: hypothetical protein IJW45_03500, partial [Oscillospiraceae bacterium]|nr:hypothetical protein [Oscillospiraceae bacterium]